MLKEIIKPEIQRQQIQCAIKHPMKNTEELMYEFFVLS